MSDIGCFFVRLKIKDCNEFLFWNVKVDMLDLSIVLEWIW